MRACFPASAVLFFAVIAGCSAAPPVSVAEPETVSSSLSASAAVEPALETSTPAPAPPPKKSDAAGDVPDDYELAPRDCQELAGQFASLIRSDQVAMLSPKLSDKAKDQALRSIEKAAAARQDQWAASCEATLVGLTKDRKSLRCAMDAKTVKAFDVCLNGEETKRDGGEATPSGKRTRKR